MPFQLVLPMPPVACQTAGNRRGCLRVQVNYHLSQLLPTLQNAKAELEMPLVKNKMKDDHIESHSQGEDWLTIGRNTTSIKLFILFLYIDLPQ